MNQQTQHPRAAEIGVGPWRYEMDGTYMRLFTGCPVLTGDVARGYVGERAAEVMCDALNTMNAVGKLPSELASENAALRDAVRELREVLIELQPNVFIANNNEMHTIMRKVLTDTESLS